MFEVIYTSQIYHNLAKICVYQCSRQVSKHALTFVTYFVEALCMLPKGCFLNYKLYGFLLNSLCKETFKSSS